ncbi:MAG: hypothetical protein QOG71_2000 [Pyrinomonadaceae bacterium]|nr:hypothetical protein [Pyrinomonadaceae bacterium]
MWIGAIRLRVRTKDVQHAGTDSLVKVHVMRNFLPIKTLKLDYSSEDDLEQGAVRNYNYLGLDWDNDQTPPLPPGIGQNPMPYPFYGLEFSSGLPGHLMLILQILGNDMWIKDSVELHIKAIRLVSTSFDTVDWREDASWTHVATWGKDVRMSTDSGEGSSTWTLIV